MGKVIETVREVNNFVRNTALVGLTAVLGAGGYLAYDKVTSEERKLLAAQSELVKAKTQVDELTRDVAAKQQQIDKLDTSIKLLKVDQRLARIDVLDQQVDSETGKTITTLNFVELSPDGNAISEPRELKVQGDTIYIDNWVVKFEDRFIEEADLIRGTSLTLFRRAFGDQQQPTEGVSLDEVGGRPVLTHAAEK